MPRYTPEEREKAVNLSKEFGLRKTCKELGMAVPTLRRWRQEEISRMITDHSQLPDKEETQMDNVPKKEDPTIHGIEEALRRDLDEARQLNRITQETIDYLIAENRELRRRCERYLKALAMVVE